MKRENKHNERIVVITGASSGIGKQSKELFEQYGDKVISLSRSNPDKYEDFLKCDVSSPEEVKQCFQTIKEKYGRVDVLVNNAGFGVSGAVELTPNEDIKNIYDVNVLGVINCSKYALELMKPGSTIINISSVCAFFPLPYRALYCATKSSVNMLSYGLKMECKPLGINVVSVCPGDAKTNFTKNRVKNFETNERYGDRIKNATNGIDGREDKRMAPIKVAKVIYKQSLKKKTKPYVIVGGKYKFLNFAMRFLPLNALLFWTEKLFGGHKVSKNAKNLNDGQDK